jgi:hypothetical protein
MRSSQRRAVNETLAAKRQLGQLERIDTAVVRAAQGLADAVDANPRSPGLWKEYREALAVLMAVGKDEAPDGLDELLADIGRAALGDPPTS